MRKKRKRLLVGRLLQLVFMAVLTVVMVVGVGQSIKLWAEEKNIKWFIDVNESTENPSVKSSELSGEVKASNQPDTKETKVSNQPDTKESIRENEVIAAFAAGNGLLVSEWPVELVELLEKNPDAEEFVLNYPLIKNQTFDIDLTEQVNGDSVPLFFQWDKRWGYTQYGSNVMGLTGCGPTCLSMVCLYLLNDAAYTPRYVADFAEENGYYVEGSGSAWTLISEGGETLGLDVTEIPLDEKRMMKNLELGNPIICIMGPGDFTTTGHFIVLTGRKDGKFVVNDPNSKTNSERLWSYEEIQGQIKNLWVCRLP